MNIETGELYEKLRDVPQDAMDQCLPIDSTQMTKKQRKNMQVSKYDSMSELGKIYTGNRKERRRQAAFERRQKNS